MYLSIVHVQHIKLLKANIFDKFSSPNIYLENIEYTILYNVHYVFTNTYRFRQIVKMKEEFDRILYVL